jgi:sentrin-specific protease 7
MKKTINASESNTTDAPYNSCGSSPRKRQKTTYTNAIDLDTDNEVVLLGVKSPHPGNLHSSPEGAPSMASKSQRSHESVQPTKHRQPPVSSFKDTDNLLNSRRKKSRSGSRVAPPKSRPCNSMSEDDLHSEAPAEELNNRDELPQDSGLESHHWSYNASGVSRINPSTSAEGGIDRDNRSTRKKNSENLRDNFRRRRGDSIEDDEQDELQVIGVGTARRVQDHSKSPGRHGTQGNTTTKQKGRIASPRWPLIYARSTYHKPDGSKLALNLRADKVFHLVYLDTGDIATDLSIDLKKIREAEADEVSRIRLKGSRDQAGNQLLFDLEFANNDQFKVFCDSYVKPNTNNKKIFLRDQ